MLSLSRPVVVAALTLSILRFLSTKVGAQIAQVGTCPYGFDEGKSGNCIFLGSTYWTYINNMTFQEAETFCTDFGLQLMPVPSTTELVEAQQYCGNASSMCWVNVRQRKGNSSYFTVGRGCKDEIVNGTGLWAPGELNKTIKEGFVAVGPTGLVSVASTARLRPMCILPRSCLPPVAPTVTSIGCFRDMGGNSRDLPELVARNNSMTPEVCVSACARWRLAGVQNGNECWCGETYGKYGRATNCDKGCTGDAKQFCGGTSANNIYEIGIPRNCSADSVPGARSGRCLHLSTRTGTWADAVAYCAAKERNMTLMPILDYKDLSDAAWACRNTTCWVDAYQDRFPQTTPNSGWHTTGQDCKDVDLPALAWSWNQPDDTFFGIRNATEKGNENCAEMRGLGLFRDIVGLNDIKCELPGDRLNVKFLCATPCKAPKSPEPDTHDELR